MNVPIIPYNETWYVIAGFGLKNPFVNAMLFISAVTLMSMFHMKIKKREKNTVLATSKFSLVLFSGLLSMSMLVLAVL